MHLNKGSVNYKIRIYSINTYLDLDINHQIRIPLYTQLACQIQLMSSVVERAINYHVQRTPSTLGSFRWRVDNKDPNQKTTFEDAFEKFSPVLLQTFSLQNPGEMLNWCDYSAMNEFMYQAGELPDYLVTKFPWLKNEMGFDIQKIIRKDIKFVDSKLDEGVQVADLLSSGLRRLLKGEFEKNEATASLFAKLFVQEVKNKPPLKLISFGTESVLPLDSAKTIRCFIKESRLMLKKH